MLLRFLFALSIVHCALVVGACAKAQAKANPDGPPLTVPAPPPRVLAPVEGTLAEDSPPAPEEPAAPATPTNTSRSGRPATNANTSRGRPAASANTPPPQEEPKAETPVPPPPVTEPAPRPAPTQADAAKETKVRDVMRKAASDLGRVDYQKLSAAGKEQYTQSQKFNEQAEQALKDRNYAFAATLADKAASISTELLGGR